MRNYSLALKEDPGFAMAHFNLGVLLAKLGRSQESERHLKAAVEISPGMYAAHFALAEILTSQGRRHEAVSHFERAASSPDLAIRQASRRALDSLK
jgi:tetratricopeptide (TPR) repeat protein